MEGSDVALIVKHIAIACYNDKGDAVLAIYFITESILRLNYATAGRQGTSVIKVSSCTYSKEFRFQLHSKNANIKQKSLHYC